MNVGVIVQDIGPSQLGFLALNQCNVVSKATDHDCCIFIRSLDTPCIQPAVACMNVSELFSFEGIIIATTIDTVMMALNTMSRVDVIFYVWDLEWLRGKTNFLENVKAYNNPRVTLVCRSLEHAKEIKNYANVQVSNIVPNFNIMAILEAVVK